MDMNLPKKKMIFAVLPAVMIILCLLTSACISNGSSLGIKKALPPGPSINPPVIPPVQTTGTPKENNVTPVQATPPPRIICNCPMEPVESQAATPAPTLDDGLCHCP
jgi:hypothetical protein